MSRPTIVCVPGAWHTPEIYDATFEILKTHGYETLGVPLPSVNADPPHKNYDQDVQSIRDALVKLIEEEGKDVVLVTHSYSGSPGGVAPKGLGKKERAANGLRGGVVRLVYIRSLAVPEGFVASATPFPEWMKVDQKKGIVTVTPADARAIFYNDVSEDVANKWIAKLGYQSQGVYESPTTYAAHNDIPSTFISGLKDASSITPEVCDWMISTAKQSNPQAFDVVEECAEGGHCPMISQPEWLADALRRAAGEELSSH